MLIEIYQIMNWKDSTSNNRMKLWKTSLCNSVKTKKRNSQLTQIWSILSYASWSRSEGGPWQHHEVGIGCGGAIPCFFFLPRPISGPYPTYSLYSNIFMLGFLSFVGGVERLFHSHQGEIHPEILLAYENNASGKLTCYNMTINKVVLYGQKNPTAITETYQIVMNTTPIKGQAYSTWGKQVAIQVL